MKNLLKIIKVTVTVFVTIVCLNSILQWGAFFNLPTEVVLIKGRTIKVDFLNTVFSKMSLGNQSLVQVNGGVAPESLETKSDGYQFKGVSEGRSQIQVMAFGTVLVKTINLEVVPDKVIYPSGILVGMRLQTDGLLVIETDNVKTSNGLVTPGEIAGIKRGDFIIGSDKIDYVKIGDFVKEISNCKGKYITIKVRHDKLIKEVNITPVKAADGEYRVGLWLRDGIAGLGTLTFTEAQSNVFGALGHGVLDVDTNIQLPIKGGNIYEGMIVSIKKGKVGEAGEIQGVILEDRIFGNIMINYYQGVFGKMNKEFKDVQNKQSCTVSSRYEVREGKAELIADLDQFGPKRYQCEISNINTGSAIGVKGFVIKITDPQLLNLTGGIVQGMSGSPVLQNGKLIGAVTHVLVNDPQKGYGVFIDSMLNTASKIAQ